MLPQRAVRDDLGELPTDGEKQTDDQKLVPQDNQAYQNQETDNKPSPHDNSAK